MKRADVLIGHRYLWSPPDHHRPPVVVTARRWSQNTPGLLRVDDGDPGNPDLAGNGFRVSSWVFVRELSEVQP
jgi:hypothetical protein